MKITQGRAHSKLCWMLRIAVLSPARAVSCTIRHGLFPVLASDNNGLLPGNMQGQTGQTGQTVLIACWDIHSLAYLPKQLCPSSTASQHGRKHARQGMPAQRWKSLPTIIYRRTLLALYCLNAYLFYYSGALEECQYQAVALFVNKHLLDPLSSCLIVCLFVCFHFLRSLFCLHYSWVLYLMLRYATLQYMLFHISLFVLFCLLILFCLPCLCHTHNWKTPSYSFITVHSYTKLFHKSLRLPFQE